MRDCITLWQRLSLAGCEPRISHGMSVMSIFEEIYSVMYNGSRLCTVIFKSTTAWGVFSVLSEVVLWDLHLRCRDQSMNAPSQWETTLQCNVISHWLGAYTKWSLRCTCWVWKNLYHLEIWQVAQQPCCKDCLPSQGKSIYSVSKFLDSRKGRESHCEFHGVFIWISEISEKYIL